MNRYRLDFEGFLEYLDDHDFDYSEVFDTGYPKRVTIHSIDDLSPLVAVEMCMYARDCHLRFGPWNVDENGGTVVFYDNGE
jgi:hypothetical protein